VRSHEGQRIRFSDADAPQFGMLLTLAERAFEEMLFSAICSPLRFYTTKTQLGHSLAAGLTWEWESFPDFMDALEPPRARHRHRGAGRALADARLCDG
jgi:hypothetical protein